MEKRFCKHCNRVTLFFMNFPVDFTAKSRNRPNKTKQICSECRNEL